MEGFYRQEGGAREFLSKEKIFSDRAIFSGEDLTLQMSSPVMIRKFQILCLKVTFLGEVETTVNLGLLLWGQVPPF